MRLSTIAAIVEQKLGIHSYQFDQFVEAFKFANNQREQVKLMNEMIMLSNENRKAKLEARIRIQYEMLNRISQADARYLRCEYPGDCAELISALEECELIDLYSVARNIIDVSDHLIHIINTIIAKETILVIVERYGERIINPMIEAYAHGNFYEFLSAFFEWNSEPDSTDPEQLLQFIFQLKTF